MRTLLQDVRYGLRVLLKSKGFTAVAVLALALGIGANTAIFSGVSAFVLRPLSGIEDTDSLVMIYQVPPGSEWGQNEFSYPDYKDYLEGSQGVFDGLIGQDLIQVALGDERHTEVVWGQIVTGNYFDTLGTRMQLGRGFLPEEGKTPGSHPVVVIAHNLWQNRFDASPSIVGSNIQLNGHKFTVVGVAPREFLGTKWALGMNFWAPLMMEEQLAQARGWRDDRGSNWMGVLGRLKPGVTQEQAAAALTTVARRLDETYPERDKGARIKIVPESDGRWEEMASTVRLSSAVALGVVGLVLLIACANVANLLLARSLSRRREIGIRLALGAGRMRIVRQLLTESVLLSLAGGGLGLLLAFWLTDLMTGFFPVLPYAIIIDLAPDTRALVFTTAVSVLTGLVFGLAPALHASKPDLVPVLKGDTTPPAHGRRRLNFRNALVVAQVALSLVVLVCAGMFVKSFRNAKSIDPGFRTKGALTAAVNPGLLGYDQARRRDFYARLVERARALPGVESASVARTLPLGDSSNSWGPVYPDGQPPPPGEGSGSLVNVVGPHYFDTMGVQLLRGRDFTEHDRKGAPPVAVVNETLAARLWPGGDALGKRFRVGREGGEPVEVVGVVRDGKYRSLGESPRPFLFVPVAQNNESGMTLIVRGGGDAQSLAGLLRGEVAAVDPRVPVSTVKTIEEHMTWAYWAQNMAASLATGFGLLALLLAATGLYSVLAYTVSQRTREIGIRMALGARRGDVLRLIGAHGLVLTLAGVGIGLAAGFALARVMTGLIFGVSPTDATVFGGISLLLAAVALVACYVPARRATKVDPMVALRYE